MYKYCSLEQIEEKYGKNDEKISECVKMVIDQSTGHEMYIDFENAENKFTYEQIETLGDELTLEIINLVISNIQMFVHIPIIFPSSTTDKWNEAINFKIKGDYYNALKIFKEIYDEYGISANLCRAIFRVLMSAGLVNFGMHMLRLAGLITKIYEDGSNEHAVFLWDCENTMEVIGYKIEHESQILQYLKEFAGSQKYECKLPYEFLKSGYLEYLKDCDL